jgi:Protein of unknown function (DUF1624).
MSEKNRVFELDVLRGVAVVLMVVFHFGFDFGQSLVMPVIEQLLI